MRHSEQERAEEQEGGREAIAAILAGYKQNNPVTRGWEDTESLKHQRVGFGKCGCFNCRTAILAVLI